MTTWKFDYLEPETAEGAVTELARAGGEAKVMAGGTALVLGASREQVKARLVVGVRQLAELQQLDVGSQGVHVGAGVRLSRLLEARFPPWSAALSDATRVVASPALRNEATVGGNLAHGVPTADLVPVALALEARLQILTPQGPREEPATVLRMQDHQALAADWLIRSVYLPASAARAASAFLKFGLGKGMEHPFASVALSLECSDGIVERARIAVGAATTQPRRLSQTELRLSGLPLDADPFSAALEALSGEQVEWRDDHQAPARYRRHLTAVLLRRAWTRARGRLAA
jgi:CO/xanthine dehydrogenase FAD-binding subunit